jgi:hypothetical protein
MSMNPSQRIGWLVSVCALGFYFLLTIGGLSALVVTTWNRPGVLPFLSLLMATAGAAKALTHLVRSFSRGEPFGRWMLFTVYLVLGTAMLLLVAPALRLSDPVEQAKWVEDSDAYAWMMGTTCGAGIGSLVACVLLMLPAVGAYFRYRQGKVA